VENFSNKNAISLLRWIFIRGDNLDQIVFYFLSSINFTSSRYFPLFDQNDKVRVVYFKGLPFKYSDFFMLKLFKLLRKILRFQINTYSCVHIFETSEIYNSKYQVLHIDDPKYDEEQILLITQWEQELIARKKVPIIVCTNQFTEAWLKQFLYHAKITIIEQGYFPISDQYDDQKHSHFCCVYSSAYIHYGNDKHSKDSTWGVDNLFDEIIPKLNLMDSEVFVHLIGELGNDAKAQAASLPNVICHGKLSLFDNAKLLSACSIGIYPRTYDHKRSILKIYSYIGAGLPVVTYDLIDTRVIKEESLGISVNSINDFIYSVGKLKADISLLNYYSSRIKNVRLDYTWKSLTKKLNKDLEKYFLD
jgi:glycosyltransferase involved in cell wall biosynthesis